MSQENLLIELGTEELPPKSLRQLAESFASNVEAELTKADLAFEKVSWLASPRRLAVVVTNLVLLKQTKSLKNVALPLMLHLMMPVQQLKPHKVGHVQMVLLLKKLSV